MACGFVSEHQISNGGTAFVRGKLKQALFTYCWVCYLDLIARETLQNLNPELRKEYRLSL
jgi:hypothetical protein